MKIKIISNNKVLCNVGEYYLSYRSGNLYFQKNFEEKAKKFFTLPLSNLKKILIKVRILERLFRLEPRIAIALNDKEFLLSYQGKILKLDLKGNVTQEHLFRKGMNNPLSFCLYEGNIYYGEYFGNKYKEQVNIYQRNLNGEWKKVYSFLEKEIMHIHQICYDKFRECFWILTGDSDEESGIWKADLNFNKVESIFRGKQKYRSCFIMPNKEGIAFVTDTPLEDNGIYYSTENKSGEWSIPERIYNMPGPCIYGTKTDNNYLMVTSVEPDSSLSPIRYKFTKKLGKGVKDRYTYIIYGNSEKGYKKIAKFKKDLYKMWLFQFGNCQIPNIIINSKYYNKNRDFIYLTPIALKKFDGKTLSISLK